MTNKKEHKILRKALSLALAMLVSILGLPLAKPQQVSATETSDPKYLSSITIDATASSSWDNKYDADFYDILTNENNAKYEYDSGYATEQTALVIKTAAELAAFARAVNVGGKDFSGKYVKIDENVTNIDLGGTDPTIEKTTSGDKFSVNITGTASNVWVPIGIKYSTPFKGNFDGGNCEISNMTVLVSYTSGDAYAGLFGRVEGASIKNTGVTGNVYASSSSSSVYAGGLVGSSGSSISNSYATGNIYASSSSSSSSSSRAGGLVGYSSSSISNSYATGDVYASASGSASSSYAYAGGLVGYSSSSISNSYATGDVCAYSASDAYAGGLAGYSDKTISNSYATGNVYTSASYPSYAGGLAGGIGSSTSISNSYATGNVYASASSSYSAYAGGLVGSSSSSTSISNSYATGDVYASSSSSSRAGGLVGESGNRNSITNSYATGDVYASSSSSYSSVYAGGLVGYNYSSISASYATGNVYASSSSSSSSRAGGLVGYSSSGSISNSYYYSGATIDVGTAGAKSSYGTGRTIEKMTGTGSGRADNTMTGLDASNWTFQDDGNGVKYLPRVKVITYNETTNPAPRFISPFTASDFDFKVSANLTYDGEPKKAEVTARSEGIGEITVKYYNSAGTNLTSAPTNAGTYTVKIEFVEGDNDVVWRNITADHWTFTIAKADPTIGSTSTTAAYKSGLILGNVTPPPCGLELHGRLVDVA